MVLVETKKLIANNAIAVVHTYKKCSNLHRHLFIFIILLLDKHALN